MDVVARLGLNEKHPGDKQRIDLLRELSVDHASVRHYRKVVGWKASAPMTPSALQGLKHQVESKPWGAPLSFEQKGGYTVVRLGARNAPGGEQAWWTGEAQCSEDDVFVRRMGRILALDRALAQADVSVVERSKGLDAAFKAWRATHRRTPGWGGDRQALLERYSFPPIFSPRPPKATLEEKLERGLTELGNRYAAIAKALSSLEVERRGSPPEDFPAEETEEVIKKAEEIIKVESLVPESELKETQEFLILRRFELFPVEKLTLDDLHVWTGYPLSTIEAILRELERQGFVTCTFEGDRGCWWLRNPGDYEPVIDLPTSAVEERDLRLEEEAARLRCQQAKLNLEAAVEEAGPKVQRKVAKALRKQGNLL